MEVVIVALIAGVVGPSISAIILNRQARQNKQLDWDRQDEVAKRAAEAVKAMAARDKTTAVQLAELVSTTDKVHILVNQKLTGVTERALAATEELLVVLEDVVARQRAAGTTPPDATLERITTARHDITELQDNLADRATQQAAADSVVEGGGRD